MQFTNMTKRTKKRTILVLVIILLMFFYIHNQFNKLTSFDEQQSFTIEKGQGVTEIANNLKDAELIHSAFWFKVYTAVEKKQAKFLPGEFFVGKDVSIKKLVNIFTNEEFLDLETDITIIEGWDIEEIAKYLDEKKIVQQKDFLKAADEFYPGYDFLKARPNSKNLEGYLYPDTYRIYQTSSAEQIVHKMLNNFEEKLTDELREKIKKQNKDIFEIITMASIIEKEMFGLENRKIASGIFWKRIDEGYPLQSDATVNFITKKGTTRPSIKDTQIDNKYNTYKYYDLPPGPICNPSIESIIATIEPTKTAYYYFLTDEESNVIFSKSYAEHQQNIAKYLD